MDIPAVDGNRTNEDIKPIDREKVHNLRIIHEYRNTMQSKAKESKRRKKGAGVRAYMPLVYISINNYLVLAYYPRESYRPTVEYAAPVGSERRHCLCI